MRALVMVTAKRLAPHVTVSLASVVDSTDTATTGWSFNPSGAAVDADAGDKLYKQSTLVDVLKKVDKSYTGHATLPLLVDSKTNTLVSTSSTVIMKLLATKFNVSSVTVFFCSQVSLQ
jgi:putative glutathione S-transferase